MVHPLSVKILENRYINTDIINVEKNAPNIAKPRIGTIFEKNLLRWIEYPPCG
jgi:hypothetical protein